MHWLCNVPVLNNKNIGLYNQSNYRIRTRHSLENCHIWSIISFFPLFILFHMAQKGPGLKYIYILTSKYSLSEGNFITIWRNTLGHILLDTMDDSQVWFKIPTNIISSNTSPHMVVTFNLVPLHWKAQFQEKDRKRVSTTTHKVQAQRNSYIWILPQISPYIHNLPSTRVLYHDYKYFTS